MKSLELTKQQARHLIPAIESDKKGVAKALLNRYDGLMNKLVEPVQDYLDEIARIARKYQGCEENEHRSTRVECGACTDRTLQRDDEIERLVDVSSHDEVRIELEDAEFEMLHDKWEPMVSTGNRAGVKVNLALDRAIEAARVGRSTKPEQISVPGDEEA